MEDTIQHMPIETVINETISQKNRIVKEVMGCLFDSIPEANRGHDFTLSDGTKCTVKQFHRPRKNEDGEYMYGFDVQFAEHGTFKHLEFSVRCSGWERGF